MRISDVIRGVLDIIDQAETAQQPQAVIAIQATEPEDSSADDAELVRMRQIAGLIDNEDGAFQNTPTERYATIDDMMSHGDDVHRPKDPADIRSNAPSMYPNFQARK
jgi:hypothetical protein